MRLYQAIICFCCVCCFNIYHCRVLQFLQFMGIFKLNKLRTLESDMLRVPHPSWKQLIRLFVVFAVCGSFMLSLSIVNRKSNLLLIAKARMNFLCTKQLIWFCLVFIILILFFQIEHNRWWGVSNWLFWSLWTPWLGLWVHQ